MPVDEPFVGEIRLMSFTEAPKGWARCDGGVLIITAYQSLFSLLGFRFGGDGHYTFGVPDLRGRTPIHVGIGHTLGEHGGEQTHTLGPGDLPRHTHAVMATSDRATTPVPDGTMALATCLNEIYGDPGGVGRSMTDGTLERAGGTQPHPNMQPFLTLSFCIALQGIFPSPGQERA